MLSVSSVFISPLFEITYVRDPLPFLLAGSLERIHAWTVYKLPPLFNHGSDKKYVCTHEEIPNHRLLYDLSTVTDDPISSMNLHDRLFLRYQLNPYRPPHLPPPKGFEDDVYRNQRPFLREVFVEATPLVPNRGNFDVFSTATTQGVCGVNVYTEATGVFADFPHKEGNLVLIYSTNPYMVKKLQGHFDYSLQSSSLIVDDVFVKWGTLGLVSLNELAEFGAIHTEEAWDDVFDICPS